MTNRRKYDSREARLAIYHHKVHELLENRWKYNTADEYITDILLELIDCCYTTSRINNLEMNAMHDFVCSLAGKEEEYREITLHEKDDDRPALD